MDKELIQELAQKVGWDFAGMGDIPHTVAINQLAKFAALVAEECAKAIAPGPPSIEWHGVDYHSNELANTIRAKFPMEEKP